MNIINDWLNKNGDKKIAEKVKLILSGVVKPFYCLDEVNFKIKEMTINEIKELVKNTKELTKDEMYNLSTHLKFFDRVNYVAWVDKLLGIKLSL